MSQRQSTAAEAVDAASWSDTPPTPHLPPSTLAIPLQWVWDDNGNPSIRYCHKRNYLRGYHIKSSRGAAQQKKLKLSPWIPYTIFAWRSPTEKKAREARRFLRLYIYMSLNVVYTPEYVVYYYVPWYLMFRIEIWFFDFDEPIDNEVTVRRFYW